MPDSDRDAYTDNPENIGALYALLRRLGGEAVLAADELPATDYVILRQWTEGGGMRLRVSDFGALQ